MNKYECVLEYVPGYSREPDKEIDYELMDYIAIFSIRVNGEISGWVYRYGNCVTHTYLESFGEHSGDPGFKEMMDTALRFVNLICEKLYDDETYTVRWARHTCKAKKIA